MKSTTADTPPMHPAPAATATAIPHRGPLAALSMAMLLSSLGTSGANVGLPAIAQDFGAPFAQVQWTVLAYLLAVTTLIVGAGRMGDLLGRRRMLLAGTALFALASALCAAAPSLAWLIAARALQGAGAALMMSLAMALVGDAVARSETSRAMGWLGTMSAIGTALGPSMGGLLIAGFGWRAIFWVHLPLGAIAIGLVWRHLPGDSVTPRPRHLPARPPFDWAGSLLLAAALGAYALAATWPAGMPSAPGRSGLGAANLALLAAAALAAGLFLRAEGRADAPLVPAAVFAQPALRASLAMSALVATVMMATLVVGPFYLARTLGLSAAGVGLALAAGPLAAALAGVPAGRLTARWGHQRVTSLGLLGVAGGAFVAAALPTRLGVAAYVLPLMAVTVGYALFQTANNTAVMADVPVDRRGVVAGMLSLSRNLGLVTGAAVMGALFAAVSGSGAAPAGAAATASGMRATMAMAGLLALAALATQAASHAGGRASSPRDFPPRPRVQE